MAGKPDQAGVNVTVTYTRKAVGYDQAVKELGATLQQPDRYVRFDFDNKFHFIEVDPRDRRYDIADGTVDESDLPVEVAKFAREQRGIYPPYTKWRY